MKRFYFTKLAVLGMRKNSRLYLPYILTCVGSVMMFYLIVFLGNHETLLESDFGDDAGSLMNLGMIVVALFSLVFLFYTNSFLIRGRKKEFGMYNILGMEKKHIGWILFLETAWIALGSIFAGIGLGILMSKAFLMLLGKILKLGVDFQFGISPKGIKYTLILFLVIFLLILLRSLVHLRLSSPVELLQSDRAGEREPRIKWMVTLAGVAAIGGGYYLCLTTSNPVMALYRFLGAVLLLIFGTYCLFAAVLIALLHLLKRHKSYYYKTRHFVTISGLLFRIRLNSVGLANLCILCTMILVMISSTVSLNVGLEETVEKLMPQDVKISVSGTKTDLYSQTRKVIQQTIKDVEAKTSHVVYYRRRQVDVSYKDGQIQFGATISNLGTMILISQKTYNRLTGKNVDLKKEEILLYRTTGPMGIKNLAIGTTEFKVKSELKKVKFDMDGMSDVTDTYYIVMKDEKTIKQTFDNMMLQSKTRIADIEPISTQFYYGFDTKNPEDQKVLKKKITKALKDAELIGGKKGNSFVLIYTSVEERDGLHSIYGSLLFLGAFLGLLFTMALVLIMYYKQISEGNEDRDRFQMMKKIGMDSRQIRSSIRSQVLTVFFLPLVVAAIHMAVAYQMIKKLLLLLGLSSTNTFLYGTVGTLVVFTVIYSAIYILTARTYYRIVNI